MTHATCGTIRERLSALIEGDLTPSERREVEDHLRGCDACAREARALRETVGALRNVPRPEPPPDMIARIERAIDDKGKGRPRGRSRVRRHAVAMILVVGLVAGIVRVIPHGPGSFSARRAPVPAEPAAEMEQAAVPVSKETASASAAKRQPAPGSAPSFARESALDERAGRKDLAKKEKANAPPAGPSAIGAVTTGADAAAPAGESAVDLLRSPRPDPAWAESVRRLVADRPGDLVRGWKALTLGERSKVLDQWKRAATSPGIAEDLDAAMERATDPELKTILHALRDFTP